jgi:multidrug efflux pump
MLSAVFGRTRTVVLFLIIVLIFGTLAYRNIPKEADPDVAIPILIVTMSHEGISPGDSERLLLRPMEKELSAIEGIKEMRATAAEGVGTIILEFDAGFDSTKALADVREKVDLAKGKLPDGTDEPVVDEVNVALFPVLTVALSGQVEERTLLAIARTLQDRIESLPGVLEAEIAGDREEVLEITVDPMVLQTYDISLEQVFSLVQRNNRLVSAGAIDTGAGRMVLKVPGVIENLADVLDFPIKVTGGTVVTFKDVAQIRRTFKDPDGFARLGGNPSVALEISKRIGANLIGTIDGVKAIVEEEQAHWPAALKVDYLQDKSEDIREMLGDLQNNVLSAILLVVIVIVAVLGLRTSILVGLAIPGSFLTGILLLYVLGYTINIIVLFSLILVVGMLVDGAIVVTEFADRRMTEGLAPAEAYLSASRRMFWPVVTSTMTTLSVFLPLLFWPDVVGEFMKFLPITVLLTLSASLFMALIFVPVLGGLIGKAPEVSEHQRRVIEAGETGDVGKLGGVTGLYVRTLKRLVARPALTLGVALLFLAGSYVAFGTFGKGVEFFPSVEPKFAQVHVRARGDLSVHEKDALVRGVEQRILGMEELRTVYGRTFGRAASSGKSMAEDVIGVIQLEFIPWDERRKAEEIFEDIHGRTADIPGIVIETREQEHGPTSGKPVQVQVSARDESRLEPAVLEIRGLMERIGGFVDVEDSRPLPGIEYRLRVDREKAARYGADVALLGNTVQMITDGVKIAEYRPDDIDDEVEIRLRLPVDYRNREELGRLRVPTASGMVPIMNFVSFEPAQKTGTISKSDSRRVLTVGADVGPGQLVDAKVKVLKAGVAASEGLKDVRFEFKGEDEDQQKASEFLMLAFFVAIGLMAVILVTQFNSIYQAGLILSAIVMSTAGVLLGLLAAGEPFGIVMSGIGVIALAGIVVNNNIVLIDTYNDLRSRGMDPMEAVLRTGSQRLRPVLLTSITTTLGLMPMMLAVNVDLIGRTVSVGAPSTQWWTQLANGVGGGLAFATALTLILTPCLLILGERVTNRLTTLRRSMGRLPSIRNKVGAEPEIDKAPGPLNNDSPITIHD